MTTIEPGGEKILNILWCLEYNYAIYISHRTENMLRGDAPYFLWHWSIPYFKNIKIWGVRVYIINGCVTRKKLDNISHQNYLNGYSDNKWVIIYWKPDQPHYIHVAYHDCFGEYSYHFTTEYNQNPVYLLL